MKRSRYRVVVEHRASFDYAMVAAEGDEVSVGREDPEMPGWYWCEDAEGIEMWVPSTHITVEGNRAKFMLDYNSVELDATVGETVQCLGESLGWMECLNRQWRYGWIPRSKLEPVA